MSIKAIGVVFFVSVIFATFNLVWNTHHSLQAARCKDLQDVPTLPSIERTNGSQSALREKMNQEHSQALAELEESLTKKFTQEITQLKEKHLQTQQELLEGSSNITSNENPSASQKKDVIKPEVRIQEATQAVVGKAKLETSSGVYANPDEDEKPSYAKPWANVTTLAYFQHLFYSGYRNQMMALNVIVMEAVLKGHGQILYTSLRHKDTFGSNKGLHFDRLFDVEHWNSFYPALPRMVWCDQDIFTHFNCSMAESGDLGKSVYDKWNINAPEQNATKPYSFGRMHRLVAAFTKYVKGRGPYSIPNFRNSAELLILRGALRPHPDLMAIVNRLRGSVEDASYMTLHARVEPDMQHHYPCKTVKVYFLSEIFEFLERKWPVPPVTQVFLPINRQYMEKEGHENKKNPNATNWIAVKNIRALNDAVQHGLWNGTVKVFEFGANALKGSRFEHTSSTPGAMLNFFISIGGKEFVGTEVSSYSHDLVATRFYRGNMNNYKYLPTGLEEWTPEGIIDAPPFHC
jgi:hypothetical protein